MTDFNSIKISQLFSALLTACYILEKSGLSHQKNLFVPSERKILQLFYTWNNSWFPLIWWGKSTYNADYIVVLPPRNQDSVLLDYVLKRKMLMTNANMTNVCSFPNPRSFVMLDITVEVVGTSSLNISIQS